MNIKANITWLIDDKQLGIESSKSEKVMLDTDCVKSDKTDIINWIETILTEKYGTSLTCSVSAADNGDFVIDNMDELIDEIKYSDFQNKIDPGYQE